MTWTTEDDIAVDAHVEVVKSLVNIWLARGECAPCFRATSECTQNQERYRRKPPEEYIFIIKIQAKFQKAVYGKANDCF